MPNPIQSQSNPQPNPLHTQSHPNPQVQGKTVNKIILNFSHNLTHAKVSMNSTNVALSRVRNSRHIWTISDDNWFNIVRLKYPIYLQDWLKTKPFD